MLVPRQNPTGPLVTRFHLDKEPHTITLWLSNRFFNPSNSPAFKSLSLQFRDKNAIWDQIKGLAEVQVGNISCPSCVHQCCHTIIKGHQWKWSLHLFPAAN